MNENIRSVLITIALCVFLIFGYMQRENFSLGYVSPVVNLGLLRRGTDDNGNSYLSDIGCISGNACNVTDDNVTTEMSTKIDFKNNSQSLKYLQQNVSSAVTSLNSINSSISKCPNDNVNNWNFNCTVPCADVPVLTAGNPMHSQVYLYCNETKPSAGLIQKRLPKEVQSLPANSECLSDFVLQSCYDGKAVPNLVHYVWFSKRKMTFYHFLSFLSASKYLRPCLILIHGDYQPFGKYWNYLLTIVPNIIHVFRNPPETVYGVPLANIEHKADIGRIQALQRFGGIYMDTDEVILRSLDPLRIFPFTLSHAVDNNLSNGLILSERNAAFLDLWLSEYKTYTKGQWAHHSTIVPNKLSLMYPDLIHVENKTFVRPNYTQLPLLFKMNFDWSKNYAIHLYIRFYKSKHNFHDIRYLNTTIGSVARHVVYGSKELCEK